MALRINSRANAPLLATVITALTMAGVMLPGWLRPLPEFPVVTTTVPVGARITRADIRWTKADQVAPFSLGRQGAWVKQTLQPGEILTASLTASSAVEKSRSLVEISPSQASDLAVGDWVSQVDVLIVKSGRILWNSGPRPMVEASSSILGGNASTIGVWFTPEQAVEYETKEGLGTVSVIGIAP